MTRMTRRVHGANCTGERRRPHTATEGLGNISRRGLFSSLVPGPWCLVPLLILLSVRPSVVPAPAADAATMGTPRRRGEPIGAPPCPRYEVSALRAGAGSPSGLRMTARPGSGEVPLRLARPHRVNITRQDATGGECGDGVTTDNPGPTPLSFQEMIVTAYCPCRKCCGRWADGLTASGRPVTANGGRFVAAPPGLRFHSLVSVPGYNGGRPVPVLDRGGAIKGHRLDVFFPTHAEALAWGRRLLTVEICR